MSEDPSETQGHNGQLANAPSGSYGNLQVGGLGVCARGGGYGIVLGLRGPPGCEWVGAWVYECGVLVWGARVCGEGRQVCVVEMV